MLRFSRAWRPSAITLADRAREARRWDLAARHYRKALRRNPHNPPIWVQYGHALKESGNPAEAEAAYRQALAFAPKVADSHLQLGRALKLQGRDKEAQAAFLSAFALDPSLVDPLTELVKLGWLETEISEPYSRLDVGHAPGTTGSYAAKSATEASAHLSPLQPHAKGRQHERRGSFQHQLSPEGVLDAEWYLATYPDVAKAGRHPVEHYLNQGQREGLRPHPYFDPDFYRRRHKEDKAAQANPLGHYLAHGQEAGYDPNPFFDNGWYAARHALDGRSALEHFIAEGEAVGAAPHPLWDEARYLAINSEIARGKKSGEWASGFRHFVEDGAAEIEAGDYRHFSFTWGAHELDYDRNSYLADNPDVAAAIAEGRFRGGLEHLFVVGFREALDGLRAIYGPREAVKLLQDLPGEAPAGGQHLCLFAHYDRDSVVDPYVMTYLTALRKLDVDIVFITATAPGQQLDKVRPLVRRILVKNDAGRDFGSWWLALKTLGMDCGADYTRVIFANDSIYCPVRPIEPVFADMGRKGYNLYGLSDSREYGQYHVQSFFLAFDRAAQEKVFPEFVARSERNYLLTKWGQIREYEVVGFTHLARKAGLSVGAYFSIDDAREDILRDRSLQKWDGTVRYGLDRLNPTHDLWDLMIGQYGFPGLKLQLLRDNPKNATGLENLPHLIADGDIKVNDIRRHQARSKAPPALVAAAPRIDAAPPVNLLARTKGAGARKAERFVLFAHYDPDGIVDDHIVFQVQGLARAGCAIAFVTATGEHRELDKVAPFCRDILVKNAVGRDFGSWELAVRVLKDEFDDFGSVIWMNDSTYFPLSDPRLMFREIERRKLDFWGIVDSNNATWHIMSWFWSFSRRAISNGWFDWYLNQYNPFYTKWAQIHNYEMRLPQMIRESGLKAEAYIAAQDVRDYILSAHKDHPRLGAAKGGTFNMMHEFWEEIITDFRCPALKVELVRDNPLRIELSKLFDVIARETDYDSELIRRHMRRLKAKHLPPPSPAELGMLTP